MEIKPVDPSEPVLSGEITITAVERHLTLTQRFTNHRLDEVNVFRCSCCGTLVSAAHGSDPDEYDPNGDMCSDCWADRWQAAEGSTDEDT